MTPKSLRAASSAALAAFLVLGVSGCVSDASSPSDDASAAAAASQAVYGSDDWAPSGYTTIGDGDVAIKFNKNFGFDGALSNEGATVVTRDGCSSLYIEVNLFDSSDTILGYANALVNNIGPGDKAKVTFQWSEDGVTRIETEKTDCL